MQSLHRYAHFTYIYIYTAYQDLRGITDILQQFTVSQQIESNGVQLFHSSFLTAAFSQQLFHSSFFTAHSRTKRTLNILLIPAILFLSATTAPFLHPVLVGLFRPRTAN
jgi:hypothetical protein